MNGTGRIVSNVEGGTAGRASSSVDVGSGINGGYTSEIYRYTNDMRKYINPPEDEFDALVERRYIEIRKAGFDYIKTVAKNTGLSEQDIIDMKKHIFLNRHNLSIDGKSYEELYFPAYPDIAYAWQMAQKDGVEFTTDEIEWFKALRDHELTEKRIMEEEGLPLRDQSTYDLRGRFKKD